MTSSDSLVLVDYTGRLIRLTTEREAHLLQHPEMIGQISRVVETLVAPEIVIATSADSTVQVYHRLYPQSPVTRKYLLVVVKVLAEDAFLLTAFFSGRMKKGSVIWTP